MKQFFYDLCFNIFLFFYLFFATLLIIICAIITLIGHSYLFIKHTILRVKDYG